MTSPYHSLNFFTFCWHVLKWADISAQSVCLNSLLFWLALEHQPPLAQGWQGDLGHTAGWRACSGVSSLERLTGLLSLLPQNEVTPLL